MVVASPDEFCVSLGSIVLTFSMIAHSVRGFLIFTNNYLFSCRFSALLHGIPIRCSFPVFIFNSLLILSVKMCTTLTDIGLPFVNGIPVDD